MQKLSTDSFNNQSVKIMNKLRILQYLYWNSGVTQLSISHTLRLSSPTIIQAIQEFKEIGFLRDGEAIESSGGRKPKLIEFNHNVCHVAGVEIRRSQLYIVIINLKGDTVYEGTCQAAFENTAAYWSLINREIHKIVDQLEQVQTILGVGIAFPGEISDDGRKIQRATVLGIQNELPVEIQQYFDYEVVFEYGAHTAGFGAVWLSKGLTDAVYVIVTDHGVAGSLIMNNQIFKGGNTAGKAGAFGHMVLVPNGKPCFCGGKGCWTTYAALSNLFEYTDNDLDEFFKRLEKNDSECLRVWEEYLDYFAQALSNIRLSLDMDIIIGGKLAKYLKNYTSLLMEKIHAFPALKEENDFIKVDSMNGNAMAVGAALIFVDRLLEGKMNVLPL